MENITQKLEEYTIDIDVCEAVKSLTVGQRILLKIKNDYGFAAKIIADATNKSLHTVNQQFKLIREKFNGASTDEILAMIRKAGITLMLVLCASSFSPRTRSSSRIRVASIRRSEAIVISKNTTLT